MLGWVADHDEILNTLLNAGMLVVWISYLQVFLAGYRRQRRASILITRSAGMDLDSRCTVTNMSAEVVFVASVLATVEHENSTCTLAVTDAPLEAGAKDGEFARTTRQGPLASGASRDIGSFRALVEHVLGSAGQSLDEAATYAVELLLVADYASEVLPVGARRRFVVSAEEGDWHVRPASLLTEQVTSRRERRAIERRVTEDV